MPWHTRDAALRWMHIIYSRIFTGRRFTPTLSALEKDRTTVNLFIVPAHTEAVLGVSGVKGYYSSACSHCKIFYCYCTILRVKGF